MEALELLDKEIRKVEYSLKHALVKPHANPVEIRNLEEKLKLKFEIRDIVLKSMANGGN